MYERGKAAKRLIDECLAPTVNHGGRSVIIVTNPSARAGYPFPTKITITTQAPPFFTNPSARAGYDTRSIFKQSLTGLNSEFSFS